MGKEIYEAYLKNKNYNDKEELLQLYMKKDELNKKAIMYAYGTVASYIAAISLTCGAGYFDKEFLFYLCKNLGISAAAVGFIINIVSLNYYYKADKIDKDIKQYSLKK